MRKMDKSKADVLELQKLTEQSSQLSKQLRSIEKRKKELTETLIKKMQTSIEAEIDGKKIFEIKQTERRSTRVDLVLTYAPELADKLIETKVSRSIKFV